MRHDSRLLYLMIWQNIFSLESISREIIKVWSNDYYGQEYWAKHKCQDCFTMSYDTSCTNGNLPIIKVTHLTLKKAKTCSMSIYYWHLYILDCWEDICHYLGPKQDGWTYLIMFSMLSMWCKYEPSTFNT